MAYLGGTSVPGYDQDKNKKVNQDGFFVLKKNQAFCLIVCDGAGSAKFSHIGSKAFSKNLANYFLNSCDQFSYENMKRLIYEGIEKTFRLLLRYSKIFKLNASINDFATTLLGFIKIDETLSVGFHIGDGAIIFLKKENNSLSYISKPENGEYSDQTFFITGKNWKEKLRFFKVDFQFEILLAMTDGVTGMALKDNQPFNGFINPIVNFLASNPDDICEKAITNILSSSKSLQISNDDKTIAWYLKC